MNPQVVLLLLLVAVPCTSARKCANYEFTCANGKCLSKWRRCRYGDDCGDGSDEQQCRKFVITVTVVQIVQSPFLWADG
ncbi:suppressor of tumorigenicity 14 protein-like [Pocillopora verrucosa]|uniref:suppressor of tumorigenicity 14 protein-like n=1 Tax=Pocillopora verrucosa TaxID=203993 RepID=UPI00333F51FE